jgi:glycosyltransferase involved in cell wall biosynthesis
MLHDENIICFAKDWSSDPTSNNHVMRQLARAGNRVLWLNSVSTRAPDLTSGRDLQKIARKIRAFADGPVEVEPNLWVYTPLVLPLPHSSGAAAINRPLVRATLTRLRKRLGMDRYQLWTFLPTALPYIDLGERLLVYYCTDEWSRFSFVDGERMAEMDRAMCVRADVVFATARSLWERRRVWNPETHLASHGVDHAHFASALDPGTTEPEELAGCARPIVGFFGLVHDWIDVGLLAHVARSRPDWTVAVIGEVKVDASVLAALPNVKLLGRRPYAELPRYCKAFSVGTMPFVINELTENVNPIKMREYLSAGLPVVSTDLPEARAAGNLCRIARTPDEFVAACEAEISGDSEAQRLVRSAAMAAESWQAKVDALSERVQVAARRRMAA